MVHVAKRNANRCPTHPGALLRQDVIPATGRTKAEIARLLGISRQHRAQTGVSRGGGSARQIRIALHRSDETSARQFVARNQCRDLQAQITKQTHFGRLDLKRTA